MSRFKKGTDPRRNTAGRPKGKPNRTTEELRSAVKAIVDAHLPTLKNDLAGMDADKRVKCIIDLLKLVLPPPLTPESLSESQLQDLMEYIKTSVNEKN